MVWTVGAGLEGKGVLVTGAARGIGKAVAEAFAIAGAKVMAADIDAQALNDVVAGLHGSGHAAASIDLVHDEADMQRKVECPLLALWGERAPMHRLYDVAATWKECAANVTGKSLSGTHYFAEEIPELVAAELKAFFSV